MWTALLDGFFKMDIGEGAFYALFGFLFVFCGILVLIAIFTVFGLIMKKLDARKKQKTPKKNVQETTPEAASAPVSEKEAEEGISPQVVAAITAAVAVCLQQNGQPCDFIVKRIKRL